jgi:hypothetical protein
MTNQIAVPQVCVLIRGGVELWISVERQPELIAALNERDRRFLKINGQMVNVLEVIGVFTPEHMDERTRRKNGQWRCEKGHWHDRGQPCHCPDYTEEVVAHVDGVGEVRYMR